MLLPVVKAAIREHRVRVRTLPRENKNKMGNLFNKRLPILSKSQVRHASKGINQEVEVMSLKMVLRAKLMQLLRLREKEL